jgi:SanA protein
MILYIIVGAVLVIGLSRVATEFFSRAHIFSPAEAPTARVAIVFGAGLSSDGSPSPILQDRVATATELYFSGKIQKILMSGDNRFLDYNEPGAMLNYALALGVPRQDIVLDYAGRRTYDTCYRAKSIFGIDEALLVTQRYHLPRAVFTCNSLGIKGTGVIADRRLYNSHSVNYWNLREVGATVAALWDVWVSHPLPVLGKPEPIFSSEGQIHDEDLDKNHSGANTAQK